MKLSRSIDFYRLLATLAENYFSVLHARERRPLTVNKFWTTHIKLHHFTESDHIMHGTSPQAALTSITSMSKGLQLPGTKFWHSLTTAKFEGKYTEFGTVTCEGKVCRKCLGLQMIRPR